MSKECENAQQIAMPFLTLRNRVSLNCLKGILMKVSNGTEKLHFSYLEKQCEFGRPEWDVKCLAGLKSFIFLTLRSRVSFDCLKGMWKCLKGLHKA